LKEMGLSLILSKTLNFCTTNVQFLEILLRICQEPQT
jgi:hypothetical protein